MTTVAEDPRAELVDRVLQALLSGTLTRDDLSTRKLTRFLGQSTIVLYHRFGSLDGFLIRVDGAAWLTLLAALERIAAKDASLEALTLGYVDFAFRHPDLYWLMTERPFDRAKLRAANRLRLERPLLAGFGRLLTAAGGASAPVDVLVLFAALHGLAALSASGRLDLDLGRGAGVKERAREGARAVARMMLGRR